MNGYRTVIGSLLKSILALVGGSATSSAAIKAMFGAGILSLFIKLFSLLKKMSNMLATS